MWLIRRTAKSTGNLYWANSDLSPHFSLRQMIDGSGDCWCHHANRRELALFEKHGPNVLVFTEYKNGKL